MNILLVNLPAQIGTVTAKFGNMYPFSLLFLSSYLRAQGEYQADILDLTATRDILGSLKLQCAQKKYGVVGFTGTTENRFLVLDLIHEVKALLPNAKIVVGGNHFSFTTDETMRASTMIDDIVRGDGEITFHDLIRHYDGKMPDKGAINGLTYRQNGTVVHTPPRPPAECLDAFKIRNDAASDLHLPGGDYSPYLNMRNYDDQEYPAISIPVGRGCPARCVFCIYNKKTYRTRSVDSLLEEIEEKKRLFACRAFHFDDPHLLKRKNFIKEFCAKLIENKLDIQWYAETRADIDLSLLDLMKEAGLVSVDLGLESASDRVLKSIKKNISIHQVSNVLHKCRQLGVRTKIFTMVSLPDETEADARTTISFLKEHREMITTIGVATTRIYPGTEMEKMALERGIISDTFSWYDKVFRTIDPLGGEINVPLWIEHLSHNYIRAHREHVLDIQRSLQSFVYFRRKFRKKFSSLLLDWTSSGLSYKKMTFAYFCRWIIVRVRIFFGRFPGLLRPNQ